MCAGMGCATISSEQSVRTVADGRTLDVQRRVTERQLEARWMQRGDSLSIELVEHRHCQQIERVAVTRELTDVRRADAGIYFEYAAAAVLLGLSALSFARPELFAVQSRDVDGRIYRDPKTGYALGGVFLGLGAGALGAGIFDTARARDRVHRREEVAVRPGPAADCETPTLPASRRQIELQLGAHRGRGVTDLEGRVHFELPGPELWPEDAAPSAPMTMEGGDDGATRRKLWKGVLRAGMARELTIEVVLPYEVTRTTPQTGVAQSPMM